MVSNVAIMDGDGPTPNASSSTLVMVNSPAKACPSVFGRLPDEIIQQILTTADPDSFASLVLVNRQTRRVSQQAHLYATQLQRCTSHASTHTTLTKVNDGDLPRLRRLFALEVKRSLFSAYNRPSETLVKLVSNSNSSSSCPGGENMQFSASSKGHYLLAYNSSRIYVLGVQDADLQVKRELKILRRPASAIITDDATTLILLSTEMQVCLYDLAQSPPKRSRTIILDKNPRTMAVSSCGSVMAAAYDTGIEVSSLHPDALFNERRHVKCDPVDTLAFSFDGTQILGTTVHSSPPNTVVLTAPYYDPGPILTQDNLSALWTTSILFPNASRDCSHAVLLQNGTEEEACWAFTYDRSFESFRAIRIDDLRNGTTYFTGPAPIPSSQTKLLPSTLPAAAYHGHLVAAGFHDNQIWVYGVPEDLSIVPESQMNDTDSPVGPARRVSNQSNCSRSDASRGQDDDAREPQWQLLCDKLRNNFVAGHKVAELSGTSMVKWVQGVTGSPARDRLLVMSRGISAMRPATEEENIGIVDGGLVCVLDFEYGPRSGLKREIVMEIGTDDAELLEEEQRDIETEVAIVRRRTVLQNRSSRNPLLHAATTANQSVLSSSHSDDDDPLVARKLGVKPVDKSDAGESESITSIEEMEALDAPYSHTNPRSTTTLRRAATAAAANRRLNSDGQPVTYRRADGQGEIPHESDADNWVPPPPPYQPEDPGTLPAFLQRSDVPLLSSAAQASPALAQTQSTAWPGPLAPPNQQVNTERGSLSAHHRTASDSTTYSSMQRMDPIPRAMSTPPVIVAEAEAVEEDLYGVSPAVSPALESQTARAAAEEANEIVFAEVPQLELTFIATDATAQDEVSVASNDEPSSVSEAQVHDSQLANLQTWSTVPQTQPQSQPQPLLPSGQQDSISEVPSGGVTEVAISEEASDILPPPPSSDQIDRLNRRISMGAPRRLSGGLVNRRAAPGSRSSLIQPRPKLYTIECDDSEDAALINSAEDPPLIISTPKGVSGALDSSGQTPILSPVPRRPRQSIFFDPDEPAPAQSLFPGLADQESGGGQKKVRRLPSWLSLTAPAGSWSSPMRVSRRSSRAERRVSRNMFDARRRGWKTKGAKKQAESEEAGLEDSGWTDVVAHQTTVVKERKCVVM